MRRRNLLLSLIIITVISFGSLVAVLATGTRPELGLDLQGGASVTLSPVNDNYTSAALDQIPELYRQRIDSLGVAEAEVNRQGNHIVVNLPGVKNKDDAIAQISVTGKVTFRPVLAQGSVGLLSACTNTTPSAAAATTPTTATTPAASGDTIAGTTPASASDSVVVAPTGSTVAAATASTTASATPSATTPVSTASSAPGAARLPHASPPVAQQTVTTAPAPSTSSGTNSTAGSTASTTAPTTGSTSAGTSATTTPGTTAGTAVATTTVPYTGPSTTAAPIPASAILTPIDQDLPTATVVLAENPSGAKTCSTVDQLGPVFAFGEKAISSASAVIDTQTGQWVVSLTLKDGANGIDAWNTAAGQCYAKADTCKQGGMAIIIDHQVISAPVPSISVFTTTGVQITGSFSESRAKALARTLAYGATPVEMKIDTTEQVSATLGKNSLHAAIIAGIIGIGLVMIFMLLYYRSLAVIVLGGIVVSGTLLWAIIAVFSRQNGLRLSLSGITGIIVSVGVTVDSYVVFFERLKDEVRGGKTLRSSALRGFRGAWRTILAADIVSLIGAVVLFQFSVGSVRGFAFFLGLSTAVDLLIAYAFTRPAVLLLAQSKRYRGGDVLGVHSGEAYAGGAA